MTVTHARSIGPAELRACVHCGLCLASCPTYLESGTEMESPRGRLALMQAVEDGRIDLTVAVVRHLDSCLGCRACGTACPSGVRYGEILETARARVEAGAMRLWGSRWWRRAVRFLCAHPHRLRVALAPIRAAQRLGVWSLVRRVVGYVNLVPDLAVATDLPEYVEAQGPKRARVGFLAGCAAREMLPGLNEAAVRVLTRNGVSVAIPRGQGCCGALDGHGGNLEGARAFARRNVDAFPEDLDAVVTTAAGCGLALKEYGRLLDGDPCYAGRARAFAGRARDITEFLAALRVRPPRTGSAVRVGYHDACHLSHGQGVRDAPRALLRAIPGVELVDLSEADICCGSAGTYNLTERAMAARLRERKVDILQRSGVSVLAVANPGCIMQIGGGARMRGLAVRVVHPIELLDEAYAAEGGSTSVTGVGRRLVGGR